MAKGQRMGYSPNTAVLLKEGAQGSGSTRLGPVISILSEITWKELNSDMTTYLDDNDLSRIAGKTAYLRIVGIPY